MPATSAAETFANLPAIRTEHMRRDEVSLIQDAAKATMQSIKQLRRHDKAMRALQANRTRARQQFRLGDKVAFFIPPDQKTVEKTGRKRKHLMQYRGPAEIINVRTPTTYDLQYKNRKYSRATTELRPYRSRRSLEVNIPEYEDEEDDEFSVDEIVAYMDNRGDANFHIGKIKATGEDIIIDCSATTAPNLRNAIWKPLYQIVANEAYTIEANRRRHQVQVQDIIPKQEAEHCIIARNLKLLPSGKLDRKSRTTVQKDGKTHHRLGTTFP